MKEKENKDKKKIESDLKDHKQYKKELIPPFLQIKGMTSFSWYYERLPELLWAVLIIGNIKRDIALNYFRYIAKFVEENPDCSDITISGISKLPVAKLKDFTKYFTNWSNKINILMRPMLLFPELPGISEWKEVLDKPIIDKDWGKIANGVNKTFWHQSQEATDCRWIKALCRVLSGKIQFPQSMENKVREILEYPNYGDMRKVRPSIRALEMVPNLDENKDKMNWANHFWEHCFKSTSCIIERNSDELMKKREMEIDIEIKEKRKHYFKEAENVRIKLIKHFFNTSETSAINSRYEGAFGLTLYGISLFMEIIYYKLPFSIAGRIMLRTLVETYITFAYLLKKEQDEPKVWDDYRIYGTGQIKLIYLKLKEMEKEVSCVKIDKMEDIANEDKWVEFIPINLGHWESANLRKMSEEIGLKETYDKFYNYTSGFIHANWGGIRESVFEKCLNPLHRFHNVPITTNLSFLSNVTDDSLEILNNILECLSIAYPKFTFRINKSDLKDSK
ncbi:MAG: hypothetical protein IBV53_08185 [Candidatus Atribacteria bacterium]